jgi:aminoglycoside phosphotransferase (APT) family kinase protein
MKPWRAEHAVDEALARALIAEQFPELAAQPLRHAGEGFDVDVWCAGSIAFRFPRRAMAVPLVESEARVLPHLASRLPVAIPRPLHLGRRSARFDAPFWGHAFLPGRTADRARLDDAARSHLAPDLARFLAALHAIAADEARRFGVGDDTFRGDLARRAPLALGNLAPLLQTRHAPLVEEARRALGAPPPNGAGATLLHGDLYARHLLLDDGGALTGVIDWGDVCIGDRAIDLAIAYSLLLPPLRDAFFAAYGPVDEATRARARHLALQRHGVLLLAYAVDVGDRALEDEAARALAFSLA